MKYELTIRKNETPYYTISYEIGVATFTSKGKIENFSKICSFTVNPFDDCQTFSINNIYGLVGWCNKKENSAEVFREIINRMCLIIGKRQFIFNYRNDYTENVNWLTDYISVFPCIMTNKYISTRHSNMTVAFHKNAINLMSLSFKFINTTVISNLYETKNTN